MSAALRGATHLPTAPWSGAGPCAIQSRRSTAGRWAPPGQPPDPTPGRTSRQNPRWSLLRRRRRQAAQAIVKAFRRAQVVAKRPRALDCEGAAPVPPPVRRYRRPADAVCFAARDDPQPDGSNLAIQRRVPGWLPPGRCGLREGLPAVAGRRRHRRGSPVSVASSAMAGAGCGATWRLLRGWRWDLG